MPNEIDLQKAKGKALAAHFKKNAAYHEKQSDMNEKCAMAHKAHGEHHEGMMGKAEDSGHGHHKASASFHKAMSAHHEKMKKHHDDHAAHNNAMVTAHTEQESAAKVLKALEIELTGDETMAVTDTDDTVIKAAQAAQAAKEQTAKAVAAAADPASAAAVAKAVSAVVNPAAVVDPAATVDPAVAAAAVAAANNPTLDKALETGLGKAITTGLERILSSPEFGKIIEEKLANMMLEKLSGQTTQSTQIQTFAVPRDGGAVTKVDTSKIDPQLAHLVEC